jgi:putative membrane protein insertion efficiency factor
MMRKSVNNGLFFFLLVSFCISISAQTSQFKSDIEHFHTLLAQTQPDPFKRSYIYNAETSLTKKMNPVGLLIGGALYVYQNVLSKHISADCLYTPSCSEFGKQAIKEYGLLKGPLLTIDRVNRCNRIAAQDMKHYSKDQKTNRYSDPVSRHKKSAQYNRE